MDKSPTSGVADGTSTLDLSGRCVGSSYMLIRPIGQGATGTVWRGVDRSSNEPVAVKLLHDSLLRQPKLVTRFVQERTILLMLRHRYVVRVRDLFSVGESLALVMDLVGGGSLREHLREHHTLPAGEAARLAAQVATALAEAHELGVIHRDLKPDNILLLTENGQLETRLTDFGIARVLNTPSLTTSNAVVGTPHYMSPESFHGAAASPAADVYALGVLLYEMVSGRPPYHSENVADLMRRHLEGDPERRPGIPDGLWSIIESCMAQKPRLRPAAAELVAELSLVARSAAAAPALPPPEPRPAVPALSPVPPSEHPSAVVPAPRRRQHRRNQAPNWRWARPGASLALIAGTMLASGVATTAWHLGRADGQVKHAQAAPPAAHVPPPRSAPAQSPAAASKPSSAAARSPAVPDRAEDPKPVRRTPDPVASPRRTPVVEARPYGPWVCQEGFSLAFGSVPMLVKPCHAVGSRVRMRATIAAPSGGSASVTVSLRDATSGRPAGGSKTCSGLAFVNRDVARDCGPATVSPVRGRDYLVLMSWTYTKDGRSVTGIARGKEFRW